MEQTGGKVRGMLRRGVGDIGHVSRRCLPPSESQHSLFADSSVKLIGQGEERAEEGSVQPH